MIRRKVGLLLGAGMLGLLLTGWARGPTVLSKYADTRVQLPDGSSVPRDRRDPVHTGIDIGGRHGQPVLATADGIVFLAAHEDELCGIRVVIDHGLFDAGRFRFYTGYCHLAERTVKEGQHVKRGEVIGLIGRTGLWGPYEHVHFDLQKVVPGMSFRWNFINPEPFVVGCFDPARTYPAEPLVLTWPVKC